MREIKFRAYNTAENRWYWWENKNLEPFCLREAPAYKVMQFTGLLDKNGKPVYEGDVVQYFAEGRNRPVKRMLVKWSDNLAGFNITAKPEIEIVGDVYTTPELLKGEL